MTETCAQDVLCEMMFCANWERWGKEAACKAFNVFYDGKFVGIALSRLKRAHGRRCRGNTLQDVRLLGYTEGFPTSQARA